jgi:hypothetical protein
MDRDNTQNIGGSLQDLSTVRLEAIFSNLLKEMRRRDSERMIGDVVTNSQTLRMFRPTGKLL